MVFPGRGNEPLRLGCAGTQVAPAAFVRISPTSTDSCHSPQDLPGGPHGDSPQMAREAVVPSVARAVGRTPLVPPHSCGPPLTTGGTDLAPKSSAPTVMGIATEGPEPLLGACDPAVVYTINNSRAASTNALYANRWKLFVEWCRARGEEPTSCPVPTILGFLQSRFDGGLAAATIRVYAAAISASHNKVDGVTVGSHTLVTRFLRGTQRLRRPQRSQTPSWDLPLVLEALCRHPFEPLESTEDKWVSLKTAFLCAMASAKRVGELHALSISRECLQWAPGETGVTLWPNPSFLPKTFSSSFVNQPLHLAAFDPPTGEDGQQGNTALLYPVRALRAYIQSTTGFRRSESLFVCHFLSGPRLGQALSKQRLSRWIVEVIYKAYDSGGLPIPASIRGHSTQSVATSWASSCTFTRFYRVNVAASNPLVTATLLSH
ncbi:uncharacterized protein LOC121713015 isoform X2 [Alosa sapidissima]|uniref:uncharacterized protein LOC121713015 isoform X1 n=1 Tax=Alosa sapidissima TaxID=34773 RepID=UPI001C08CCA6|nr:uncharacterized protein LOC121713015 isoform X1 [Alosa sapidissima]XP_041953187.1 uncharacterized protein LOC121713015 isoform X2 [Alosa sapidissima]